MNFRAAILALGKAQDWREAVLSFRDQHGAGASRWIANRFGVNIRTAQKWLKGTQAPAIRGGRRDEVRGAGNRRFIAARALRNAQLVSVGRVRVVVKSTGAPDGTRGVGTVTVDDELRAELGEVADLLAAGSFDAAEDAMSDALLGAYAVEHNQDNRDAVRTVLAIDPDNGYPNGIEVS